MVEKPAFHRLVSKKAIVAALAFGASGWLMLSVGIYIPIIGTEVYAAPHELFITLGAALTGPVGGAMVALIADSARPTTDFKPVAMLAHILGSLWMGWAYKHLVYRKLKFPLLLAGWIGIVLVYYYFILAPFVLAMDARGIFPPEFLQRLGPMTPWQVYVTSMRLGTPEALMIIFITTITLAVLPSKYRRPLW